jgi:hypothetical protein
MERERVGTHRRQEGDQERAGAPAPADASLAAALLPLHRSHGNAAIARAIARRPSYGAARHDAADRVPGNAALQRMALALDDLVALASRNRYVDKADVEHARTTSEAVQDRVTATGERLVRPHMVASGASRGALADIGRSEELRIFGHGAVTELEANGVVTIGDYDPSQLANLLRDMGLPRNFVGEIYLAGCLSAVGPNYGFLGEFYRHLAAHCPGVVVRGNLGRTITLPDGTQAVSNGTKTSEEIAQARAEWKARFNQLTAEADTILPRARSREIGRDEAIRIANAIMGQLAALEQERRLYLRSAYDGTGRFTVQLPSGDVRAGNAIEAVVRGAVTRAEDIDAILQRVDETSLGAAKQRLASLMPEIDDSIRSLVTRTEALAAEQASLRFAPRQDSGRGGATS